MNLLFYNAIVEVLEHELLGRRMFGSQIGTFPFLQSGNLSSLDRAMVPSVPKSNGVDMTRDGAAYCQMERTLTELRHQLQMQLASI